MVGNAADARIAHEKHYLGKRPKGWKNIGEGCTRTAYLSPDKVVYKVGEPDVNLLESSASRRFGKMKALEKINVFVPKARTYRIPGEDDNVLAMEYVKPEVLVSCAKEYYWRKPVPKCNCNPTPTRPCFREVILKLEKFGIYDMWSGNLFMTKDERFHIIDLGAIK